MKKYLSIIIILFSQLTFAQINDSNQENSSSYSLTKEDRIFGLVTIYQAAKQHFAYFEKVPQLDWDKEFKQYLKQVEKEQSLLEYYRTLEKFIALLQDGHSNIYLPKKLINETDNLPFILSYIEDKWVVTERYPNEEILKTDIPCGSILLAIDGIETNDYFQNKLFPYIAHGTIQGKRNKVNWLNYFAKDPELKIKFLYPDGNIETRTIKANRNSSKWTSGNRKKFIPELSKGPNFLTKTLDSNILYIRFRQCDSKCENSLVSLIENFNTDCPSALIIDLRKNGGGNTPMNAIKHLISQKIRDRDSKTRCSISWIDASINMALKNGTSQEEISQGIDQAKKINMLPKGYVPGWLISDDYIEPTEKHYNGKIVILTDVTTGSAAEDMASRLKNADNVKIIGELTNGSTGMPIFYDLPEGGQLRICTINTPLSGVGVKPDILVNRTIKGIVSGKDEILQSAMDYLKSSDKENLLLTK